MNEILREHSQLEPLLERQSGVLLHSDLEAFWRNQSPAVLNARIQTWMEAGYLRRVCRGVFVAKRFDPRVLALRMVPDAVISTVSVLASQALVGTAPHEQVWCVRAGRTREYRSGGIAVHAWSQTPELLNVGWEWEGAIRVATPEKAFLDTLYYHLHGRTYPFAVPQDIDTAPLDRARIEEFVEHYRNPRFRSFVRGVLHDGI